MKSCWGPSIVVNKQIPLSPITLTYNEYIINFLCGLTYEPSTDDYLVVLGYYQYDDNFLESGLTDLEIFSLRANKWKQIEFGSPLPYKSPYDACRRLGSFLNGAIHWLSKVVILTSSLTYFIIYVLSFTLFYMLLLC